MYSNFVFIFKMGGKHCKHCHCTSYIWRMSWLDIYCKFIDKKNPFRGCARMGIQYLANPKFNLTKIFRMRWEIFLCAGKYFECRQIFCNHYKYFILCHTFSSQVHEVLIQICSQICGYSKEEKNIALILCWYSDDFGNWK